MKYKITQLKPFINNKEVQAIKTPILNNFITEGQQSKKFLQKLNRLYKIDTIVHKLIILLLTLMLIPISGCGAKGSLYLPPNPAPTQIQPAVEPTLLNTPQRQLTKDQQQP